MVQEVVAGIKEKVGVHDGVQEAVQKPCGESFMRSWDCSQIENKEEEESWREGTKWRHSGRKSKNLRRSCPWPFWLKRFACVNVVSRPAGLAMVSAARRAASRAGYAWRRKQPGISSAVELLFAAGRFLQLESGWTMTELLALSAGGSIETGGATLQSCCIGGIERGSQIDAHEEAIIELERVQALLKCRLESMEGRVTQLWNFVHGLLGPCNEQCSRSLENISSCAKLTVSELNACMAVFGGSLVDEPFCV